MIYTVEHSNLTQESARAALPPRHRHAGRAPFQLASPSPLQSRPAGGSLPGARPRIPARDLGGRRKPSPDRRTPPGKSTRFAPTPIMPTPPSLQPHSRCWGSGFAPADRGDVLRRAGGSAGDSPDHLVVAGWRVLHVMDVGAAHTSFRTSPASTASASSTTSAPPPRWISVLESRHASVVLKRRAGRGQVASSSSRSM